MEKEARENYVAKFNQRMDLVKSGVAALKSKDFKTALSHYYAYLELLQKFKGGGELTPQLFDPKSDAAEMLMVTGVYWDLAKIFDKMGDRDKPKLRYYIDKFVLFSKNTSYQKLSQEMLRKFLQNDSPNNRAVFKEAYTKLGGGKCFVATAVEEHCENETMVILRRFRDEILLRNFAGRIFVKFYYFVGPWIAIRVIRSGEDKQKWIAAKLGIFANAVSCRFFPDGKNTG